MRRTTLLFLLLLIVLIILPISAAGKCVADKDYIQDSAERERMIAKADREEYNVRRVAFFMGLRTWDETVRRKIFLNEGDIFTRENLDRSLRNLSKLKQFIDPGRIEDVRVILHESERFIDFDIHFFDKRDLGEVDDLVGKDIYAAALYAALEKMQEEWGKPQKVDFTQAIILRKKKITSKIPASHNNFTVVTAKPEEFEARYVSSGKPLRVYEVLPYVQVGSSIRIRVEAKSYSLTGQGSSLVSSGFGDVYLSLDWRTDRLRVNEVCLGRI